jgi:hypothetical protein
LIVCSKQDKDEAKRLLALLVDAAEHEQTPEEAEEELIADGVNVSAFLARVHADVQQKQTEERLAWRREARRNADEFAHTQELSARYAAMTRPELIAEAQQTTAYYKNFEEATDDDLRTLLADRARLEELSKKK